MLQKCSVRKELARTPRENQQAPHGLGHAQRSAVPPYNIQERTFEFSTAIVRFCRDLVTANPVTRKLSWQLLDSATSVGANMEEADAGQSTPDFVSKTAIARKESKETVYWLRLIVATDAQWRAAALPLLKEANEIASIVSTINRNADTKARRKTRSS